MTAPGAPDLMEDPRGVPPQGRVWCGGTAKSTGKPCKLLAIPGGTVCRRYHGGAAPQVERKAAERERERVAAEELASGLEATRRLWAGRHPIESAEQARATAAAVTDRLFERLTDADFDGVEVDGEGSAVRVTFTMEQLLKWNEQTGKLSKASLDAGTEERKVRIDEAQGAALVDAFRRFEAAMLEVVGEALTAADAPPEVLASVRSAWSAALPAVVRAATEPDGPVGPAGVLDAREVGA